MIEMTSQENDDLFKEIDGMLKSCHNVDNFS